VALPTVARRYPLIMEPITIAAAVSGATAAFNSIKQMIAAGRDMESCITDVSRWMKMAQAWADLIQLEGKIRRQRQEAIYKQQELRQQIVEVIAIVILGLLTGTALLFILWMAFS
jgi:hypothetical protein